MKQPEEKESMEDITLGKCQVCKKLHYRLMESRVCSDCKVKIVNEKGLKYFNDLMGNLMLLDSFQNKPTPPEEADINVAHLAADKAMRERWRKELTTEVIHLAKDNFIKFDDQHKVLQVVRFALLKFEKQQRSEVAREILEKWTTRMAEIQDDLDEIYPDNSYHPNCGGILEGITEEYLKENEATDEK